MQHAPKALSLAVGTAMALGTAAAPAAGHATGDAPLFTITEVGTGLQLAAADEHRKDSKTPELRCGESGFGAQMGAPAGKSKGKKKEAGDKATRDRGEAEGKSRDSGDDAKSR